MLKKLILLLLLLPGAMVQAQNTGGKEYDLLVGGYTTGKGKGIYVFRFNAVTGKTTYLNAIAGVNNPSYLTLSANNKFVYSVNEVGTDRSGSVSSFSFEPASGKLTALNAQPSVGAGPCYVSTDKAGKYVFIANYAGGSMSVLPIKSDGSLGEAVQTLQDEGSGIDKDRQDKPHVHTAVLSPDEKYLFYTDLGTDKLNIYRYDAEAAKPLSPAVPSFVMVTGGYGPRHIVFTPNARFLYLIDEMGAAITAFTYQNGKLAQIQSQTLIADGYAGKVGAADIHTSADGRFLYSTNRGDVNEIEVFSIEPTTGKLAFVQRTPSLGKTPRNFVIDPGGNFLLVANQSSDDIFIFRVNKNTGKLTYTGQKIESGNPTCLKFAPSK